MAAAYRTSAAGGGNTGTGDRTCTITPAVNDLFLVFGVFKANTNTTPTCTDANTGGTYDRVFAVLKNSSADMFCCFIRQNLLANTTSTTVTIASGSNSAGEIVVVALSGFFVAGSAAVVQSATQANQAGSTTPAPAFGAAAGASNFILGAVGNGTNPATMTPPAGTTPTWSERQDVGQATNIVGLEVVTATSGFSGTTVTWGGTSASAFASGIVELSIAQTGVNVTKALGYTVLGPMAGVDVTKALGYTVLGPMTGVNVTKAVGYVVLGPTNVAPPSWDFTTFPDGFVGVPYSQSWNMASAALTVSYSVLSGSLPPGLALSALSGNQAKISGTPTTGAVYPFTLRAVNTYGTADQAFSITITAASPPPSGAAYAWIQ